MMELRDIGRYVVAFLVVSGLDLLLAIVWFFATGDRHEPHTTDAVIVAAAYTVLRAIRERRDTPA